MFDVRANVFENVIHVSYRGKMDLGEVMSANEKILQTANSLKPGFVIITDIRELTPLPEEARSHMQQKMSVIRAKGLAAEVRIISSQAMVTANQFQRSSRAAGYTAHEVNTPNEAERVLDNLQ